MSWTSESRPTGELTSAEVGGAYPRGKQTAFLGNSKRLEAKGGVDVSLGQWMSKLKVVWIRMVMGGGIQTLCNL